MAVLPEQLVDLAAELLNPNPSEPRCRAAISRAYYGAFHAAQQVCPKGAQRSGNEKHGSHEAMIVAMTKHRGTDERDNLIRNVGHLLNQLRPRRRDADYRLEKNIDQRVAERVICEARIVLRKIERIRSLQGDRAAGSASG